MNTQSSAPRRRRRVIALLLLLTGAMAAMPALAAGPPPPPCPDPKISPANQEVPDFTPNGAGTYLPTVVQLNGQPSQPNNATFLWTQLSGPTVALSSATAAKPTFPAPDVEGDGEDLVFRLTVTAACGSASLTTTIAVNDAHDPTPNHAPTAVATATPDSVNDGGGVTLDGTASYDIDDNLGTPANEDPIVSYQWAQVGPGTAVTLVGANSATATFVAPNTTAPGETLTFRLTVRDGGGLSGTDDAVVNVTWVNDPPVAALTCPDSVGEGEPILLDGTLSNDIDDGIVLYAWSQLTGPPEVATPIAETLVPTFGFAAPTLGYLQTGALFFRLRVTDATGAFHTADCGVFVRDVTAPVIAVSASTPLPAEATSSAGAEVRFTAFDAVDGDLTDLPSQFACTPASGATFALGHTPASCTATDSALNTATANFDVLVVDTTPPAIEAHGPVAVQAEGPSGAVVNYTIPATHDIVDGDGEADCSPASGSTFPLDGTLVSCTATDVAGNTTAPGDEVTFLVTVYDTLPPVLSGVSGGETAEATSAAGAVVSWPTPTAADLVDGNRPVACASTGVPVLSSGSTFPLGATTVTCSASDTRGNTALQSFVVTVADTTPPTLAGVSSGETAEATSAAGAVVSWPAPTATDLVDGSRPVTCESAPVPVLSSGSTFPLGATTVTCTTSDTRGNAASQGFVVTVVDTTAPALTGVSSGETAEATSAAGAVVSWAAPTAMDLVDGSRPVACAPASGGTFPLGNTTVVCSTSDTRGNATSRNFIVTVVDTTAPALSGVSSGETAEATSAAGAVVSWAAPTAVDLVDGSRPVGCAPAAGGTFPLGNTTVVCTTSDTRGNAASQSFVVTVVDTTAPALSGVSGGVTAEATSGAGAVVTWAAPTAVDLVDGSRPVACAPAAGGTFPLGNTTVVCSTSDTRGNAASQSFVVTVVDTTAPALSGVSGNLSVDATSAAGAVVNWPTPTAVDLVDGNRPVSCESPTGLTSGSTFPLGTTTVTCTATDTRGNTASQSFDVTVHYAWTGFFRPIDNLPTVNSVRAGSAVPVKFNLGGDMGLAIFAAGYPRAVQMQCSSGTLEDTVEETVTAGGSSLVYDAAAGQYVYVWKSDKLWAGSCRQLQLKLADGTLHVANFRFTK